MSKIEPRFLQSKTLLYFQFNKPVFFTNQHDAESYIVQKET